MTTKQKRQDEAEAIGAATRKELAEIVKACGDQSLAVKMFTEGKIACPGQGFHGQPERRIYGDGR